MHDCNPCHFARMITNKSYQMHLCGNLKIVTVESFTVYVITLKDIYIYMKVKMTKIQLLEKGFQKNQ